MADGWLERAVAFESLGATLYRLSREYGEEGNQSESDRCASDARWYLNKAEGYRAKHLALVERNTRDAA